MSSVTDDLLMLVHYVNVAGHEERRPDMDFPTRLKRAVDHAGLDWSQTRLAEYFGTKKQTVDGWMRGSEPLATMLFSVADKLGVDARWLATGEGSMLPPPGGPGLKTDELELVRGYRSAPSQHRASIRVMAKTLAKGMLAAALLSAVGHPDNADAANAPHNSPSVYYVKSVCHYCKMSAISLFVLIANIFAGLSETVPGSLAR